MIIEEDLNKYACTETGQIYDKETGEIVSTNNIKKALETHLNKEFEKFYQQSLEIGKKIDLVLIKDKRGVSYQTLKIKEDYEFVKVFTVSKREIKKASKLSKVAKAAWFDLEEEIHFPTNSIVIDGKSTKYKRFVRVFRFKEIKII
jgi:hydroxymethylpyrimidine pyrophosphatase-like HAD family hydrolase